MGGLPQGMVAQFQEQVSQENQEEAQAVFITSPQIQGEGTGLTSQWEESKSHCNKNMLDVSYYCDHFWKIQLTTDALEAKGGTSSQSWVAVGC